MALAAAGFTVPAARPVAAQGGPWNAQFYNNLYLLGDPVWTTQYGSLELNWGASSPGPGVDADNFSARLATDVYFAAGTYRFYIQADDAFKFVIDYPPLAALSFSNLDAPTPGQLVTLDATLTTGFHHLQLDYRELSGEAYAHMSWSNVATNPQPPTFAVPVVVGTAPWTAQYFSNPALSGVPVVTQTETNLSHDWGTGVPVSGVVADNFSARWTSLQTLTGGTYEISVGADDGVRVYVDNVLVINEFHTASSQTYKVTLPLSAGTHWFVVEYYESLGTARIDFRITLPGGVAPAPVPATGPTITVLAARLNVRDKPSVTTGAVLTVITSGATYPAIGRNADSTWFQINANGVIGWVSGAFVRISNPQGLPVTDGVAPPVATGYNVTARVNLNIRSGPGVMYARVSILPLRQTAEVIGRNAASTWWHIRWADVTGWVSAFYTDLTPGADLSRIPITG
jgi:uncharacterized protein YraI